jgi:hypothetical protein
MRAGTSGATGMRAHRDRGRSGIAGATGITPRQFLDIFLPGDEDEPWAVAL